MVLPNKTGKTLALIACCALTSSIFMSPSAGAQGGLPLPGGASPDAAQPAPVHPFVTSAPRYNSAPAPTAERQTAPIPGGYAGGAQPAAPGSPASSNRLPLNPGNAQARLEELRNMMVNARPKEFEGAVGEYCDWLSDMADAHWKLYQTFGKTDAKGQAESERQLCLKFGALKRQGMLLKAEFLVAQHRNPEALAPLVDLVAAEPRTETGQTAYRLLQEIGFSQESYSKAESAAAPIAAKPSASPVAAKPAIAPATAKPPTAAPAAKATAAKPAR